MIGQYVWRDLRRNPRRSLTALAGMTLGIGLFSAVLFFIDRLRQKGCSRANADTSPLSWRTTARIPPMRSLSGMNRPLRSAT